MRVWRPVLSLGGVISLLLVPALWVLAAWLWGKLFPVSGLTFWFALGILLMVSLGAVFLYESLAFFTLRYVFDRNGLTLYWGGLRQIIPMNRITMVRRWAEGEQVVERGLHWPGLHRGRGRSAQLGDVEFYATAGRWAQVLVCTTEGTYVLSPRRPEAFMEDMEVRRNLGITRQLAQERLYWWFLGWSLWRDAALQVLYILALLINFALLALLCYRYPTLPPRIPVHFVETIGEGIVADIIGQSQDLFKLPAFGLVLWVANFALGMLFHRRYRLLVLLLAGTALLVQVMFGLGVIYILYH